MAQLPNIKAKIMSREALQQQVQLWQAAGETVVFTNGCFDILHYGHVDYLHQASELGNRLVVGLNTDVSVSRLKGPNRPLQNEVSRSLVMAALGCVDALCLFDEATPLELITDLQPDVLVKGADYSVDQIVGAQEVLARGGKVVTITLSPGYSTTAIEQRIQASKL
jgi:D-glycero-beta-D-manno-heptose 1-phosphate adenylyltransferase